MQSKVSIVIPCYNKEKWISGMFDSILAQVWDNIELILINDGSTDRTRDIITEYGPRFVSRGFEVIIIDQENQGVSAAVHNGLMRISGEYVCQIDADDELDPRYVSMMAGWLEENPDYDWTACDALIIKDRSSAYMPIFPDGEDDGCNLEKWLLTKTSRGVWAYLVRTNYLMRCNVIETYYIENNSNQEAQFFIPLVLGKGKIKFIRKPLYIYNQRELDSHRSYSSSYENAKKRWTGFIIAYNVIFRTLPIDESYQLRLCAISEFGHRKRLIEDTIFNRFSIQELTNAIDYLYEYAIMHFIPKNAINSVIYKNCLLFCTAIENNILNCQPKDIPIPTGRKIAWGALGRNATILLPYLKDTVLEPDELWDASGDGEIVKKPDLDKLTVDDLVLVLPLWNGGIVDLVKTSSCKNIIFFDDILTYLSAIIFPDFYNGKVQFVP